MSNDLTSNPKLLVSLQDLGILAATATRNGTEPEFMRLALDWAESANAEIDRLTRALAEARRDIAKVVNVSVELAQARPPPEASGRCIWDDCDQEAVYCPGHAKEFADGERPSEPLSRLCEYEPADGDPLTFYTACNQEFRLSEGLELYEFCPYCGGRVDELPQTKLGA